MARRNPRKQAPGASRKAPPPSLPDNACWIESDRYDRHAFGRLRRDAASLREMESVGEALVPHFAPLMQDVFCLLFKYNVVFAPESEVLPSAALNRTLLTALRDGEACRILREATVLDEARAGLCTLLVGEGILAMLKSEKPWTRHDMLDAWKLRRQEEEFHETRETLEHAGELSDEGSDEGADAYRQDALARVRERLDGKLRGDAASIRHRQRQYAGDMERVGNEARARVQAAAVRAAQRLDEAVEEADLWGSALGQGGRLPAHRRLELGRRLAGNDKLKKLVRMVGRMKSHALALRKRTFERANEELHSVEQGGALERLLPQELTALRHPVLHRDFQRRLLENELLQYSLRGMEEKRKGPVVVCLDGSSSMAGDKELWSKAVALTLLELTRRQRRPFRSICFSSGETALHVLDLATRRGGDVEADKILDLAEHFPGGGTDFEKPLDAALECLGKSRYKKADVVFITDGECQVSAEWSQRFRKEKERLRFSLFSILIDVGPSSAGSLGEFSDRITTITQLTSEGAGDLFLRL